MDFILKINDNLKMLSCGEGNWSIKLFPQTLTFVKWKYTYWNQQKNVSNTDLLLEDAGGDFCVETLKAFDFQLHWADKYSRKMKVGK